MIMASGEVIFALSLDSRSLLLEGLIQEIEVMSHSGYWLGSKKHMCYASGLILISLANHLILYEVGTASMTKRFSTFPDW